MAPMNKGGPQVGAIATGQPQQESQQMCWLVRELRWALTRLHTLSLLEEGNNPIHQAPSCLSIAVRSTCAYITDYPQQGVCHIFI